MPQRSWTRRGILRWTAAGAGALVLAACSSAPPTAAPAPTAVPPAKPADAAKPAVASTPAAAAPAAAKPSGGAAAEITFWGHNHEPRVQLDKELLDTFLKENAGAKVEYVVVPQEYEVKLTTAMAAGTGPDGYNLTATYTYPFMAKGIAAEIDPSAWNVANGAAITGLYVDGSHDAFSLNGKLYGVVSEYSNYGLFLNTKMYKDAGVDLAANGPKTWEDMVPLAAKVTKRQGDTLTQRGFDFTYMTQQGRQTSPNHSFIGMAFQLGGDFFTADKKATNLNTEPFIRALQFQQDWIYKEKLGSPAVLGANTAFQEGSVGGTLTGFWSIPPTKAKFPDVAANFTVRPFPQFKDAKRKSGAALYGYARMVNAKSSEAARSLMWRVHKAWSSDPKTYLDRTGLLQPTKAYVASDDFKKVQHLNVFLEDAIGTPYILQHNNSIEISNALTRGLERVTQEKADPKASLDQAKKEIDDIIAKG